MTPIGAERMISMNENAAETRLKRLRLRSWRRGTREMDLMLGAFADARLATMAGDELDRFESLLEQTDQDLSGWLLAMETPPESLQPAVREIREFLHDSRLRGDGNRPFS